MNDFIVVVLTILVTIVVLAASTFYFANKKNEKQDKRCEEKQDNNDQEGQDDQSDKEREEGLDEVANKHEVNEHGGYEEDVQEDDNGNTKIKDEPAAVANKHEANENRGNEEDVVEDENGNTKIKDKPAKLHAGISEEMSYIGHPFPPFPFFPINKNRFVKKVLVGSPNQPMIEFQDHKRWLKTQEKYMDTYNLLRDKLVFNFQDFFAFCPILQTLETFIKDIGEIGFATKGYHLGDHIGLFGHGCFCFHRKFENFFLFLERSKTARYFTKCCKEPDIALYCSVQNIYFMNVLHERLQSNDIIQINVFIDDDHEHTNFCSGCFDNNLYINGDVLTDIEKFKLWWSRLLSVIQNLRDRINLSADSSPVETVSQNIKKEMISYEAVDNHRFPLFSLVPEFQIREMDKYMSLTLQQSAIIHTDKNFFFIRGPYGSGKSFLLAHKLESIIGFINKKDIIYLICNDQQSKLADINKWLQRRYPTLHIIVCNSSSIVGYFNKPKLSCILNHMQNVWKDRTVHLLIDEFNGSYITKSEVSKLKDILSKFSNSYIIVALQSTEEVVSNKCSDKIDLGYRYDLLQENGFPVYNLIYCFRSSFEINEFVRIAAEIMKNVEFVVNNTFEEAIATESSINKKITYNNPGQSGHHLFVGLVSLFIYNSRRESTEAIKFSIKADGAFNSSITVFQVYLSTLQYILPTDKGQLANYGRFVICTYNEELYNSIYYFLENQSSFKWTCDVKKFRYARYDILLTDYASIRGYTFPNVIFLLCMGDRNFLHRIIECCTRASTKLYVIADNVNTSQDSVENQLIEAWKQSNYVSYFNLQYAAEEDRLFIIQDNVIKHTRNQLSEISVGNIRRFPWSISDEEKEESRSEKLACDHLSDAIYYICENDNVDIFYELLKAHNIDIRSYEDTFDGRNLFHMASTKNSVNILKFLIDDFGWDVNCETSRYKDTPLHLASSNGHLEAVELLLQNNAEINAINVDGFTPLHCAVDKRRDETITLLLENNASLVVKDKFGRTPFLLAGVTNQREIVDIIRNHQSRNKFL